MYYYAVDKTDFKPNPVRTEGTHTKYTSLDDKIDGFFTIQDLLNSVMEERCRVCC